MGAQKREFWLGKSENKYIYGMLALIFRVQILIIVVII